MDLGALGFWLMIGMVLAASMVSGAIRERDKEREKQAMLRALLEKEGNSSGVALGIFAVALGIYAFLASGCTSCVCLPERHISQAIVRPAAQIPSSATSGRTMDPSPCINPFSWLFS